MFAWAITNIAIIACFTMLAIFFDKWWIVLFSGLFTFEYKRGGTKKEGGAEDV